MGKLPIATPFPTNRTAALVQPVSALAAAGTSPIPAAADHVHAAGGGSAGGALASGSLASVSPFTQTWDLTAYLGTYSRLRLLLFDLTMLAGSATFQALNLRVAGDSGADYSYRGQDTFGGVSTNNGVAQVQIGFVNGTNFQNYPLAAVYAYSEVWLDSLDTVHGPTITARGMMTTASAPGTISNSNWQCFGLYWGNLWAAGAYTVTAFMGAGQLGGNWQLWGS